MKSKKIVCLLLVFLIMILTINITSYAVTLPKLTITSNNYAAGDKMEDNVENNVVEVEKTLQLYAVLSYGNDMLVNNNDDSLGWFVKEANLNGVTWASSNTDIATVDSTGKVTGIAEGKTTITANYNNENATYEVNVKAKSNNENEEEDAWIKFGRYMPEPAKILNEEYGFTIYLHNIPETEKDNIKVTIEDEEIAKITEIVSLQDGSEIIIANVKFLKVGQTKITATLDYNGKTYSDTFEFSVIGTKYSLKISAKEYTDLPSSLGVRDKIQLIVMMYTDGSSLPPEDVTTKGVTYTSSNEKVVKVDNKGLVTAIGKGTATITAKYKVGDETISAKYKLKITDSTKSPENPGTSSEPTAPSGSTNPGSSDGSTTKNDPTIAPTNLPKTGENITIIVIGIILILSISISMIMYKKYKNIK